MNTTRDPNAVEGMRIKLVSMTDDPNPIPKDTLGTISLIDGAGVIHVNWDNGRRLGVIPGTDEYILEPDLENVFDKLEETTGAGGAGGATASGPYSPALGSQTPVMTNVKPKKVKKKVKKKKLKENIFTKQELINELTNTRSQIEDTSKEAWADKNNDGWRWNDSPAYHKEGTIVDPLAKIDSTWDDDNLDISKDWDKYQNKLKKEDILRMVKKRLNESEEWFEETFSNPIILDLSELEVGDIVTPVCPPSSPSALKHEAGNKFIVTKKGPVGTRQDQPQQAVPHDMVTNLVTLTALSSTKTRFGSERRSFVTGGKLSDEQYARCKFELIERKNEIKKEEQIEETTTFGSVFGTGFPVVPAFAAKKGQWKSAKKPIWKGGKIVQQIENSGVLNPVNEANTVKYNKGGKFVKIKKKCTKFPYCSQGAIDNPLSISDKATGDANYVENFMKNIHEVAKETGKTFDEVYNTVKANFK